MEDDSRGLWLRGLLLLILGLALFSASLLPQECWAGDWSTSWGHIEALYYQRGRQDDAIQTLAKLLEDPKNTYPENLLPKIAEVLGDYFRAKKDLTFFRKILLDMFSQAPRRISQVVRAFSQLRLRNHAEEARKEWLTPATADVKLRAQEVKMGGAVGFEVKVYNRLGKVIPAEDMLEFKVEPGGLARMSSDGRSLVAEEPGEVKLRVLRKYDGRELAWTKLVITGEPKVSVEPTYIKLPKGESAVLTVTSTRPWQEAKGEVKAEIEPPGLADFEKTTADATSIKYRVTARQVGKARFNVLREGTKLAAADIVIPTGPPSMLYALVSTGAGLGLGVFTMISWSQANDKYDEAVEAGKDLSTQEKIDRYNSLRDDYDSKITQTRLLGVATGVVAAGAGYLWYRYLKAKGDYRRTMQEASRREGHRFIVDLAAREVGVSVSF